MRVLYFTIVSLGTAGNGGGLCCRNHVERLVADPGIELFAMTAGPIASKAGNDAFFARLNVTHYFQPFREGFHHEANNLRSIADFAFKAVTQFPWEMQALNQPHIEEGIAWAVKGYSIDVLVIDYHPSALFIRIPRTDVATALIGLNREGDFYSDLIRLGQTNHGSLTAPISLARSRRWERKVNAAVDQVITIGPPDLPKHRTRRPPVCITPYLTPKPAPDRWTYTASNRVFFVGTIGHYPNRLAIGWLTGAFALKLLAERPDAKITIVGASAGDISTNPLPANVDLLGPSDGETASRLFRTCDLMLCPVENDYGVKFKALEALSFGTPILASRQTMMGLPHLRNIPSFDLGRPDDAAVLVADLLADRDRLVSLANEQQQQQQAFIETQGGVWSRILGEHLR